MALLGMRVIFIDDDAAAVIAIAKPRGGRVPACCFINKRLARRQTMLL